MAKDNSGSMRGSSPKAGQMSLPGTATKVRADRYRTSYAPGEYAKSRKPATKPSMISLPGTAMKVLSSTFKTKYTPGDYAAYRKTLPGYAAAMKGKKPAVVKPAAKVISNVTREKLSPTKTTGFTTGTTTGSSASKPGVAGKTYQSAYGRMMSNAERRFGVAGPTGSSASKPGVAGKTYQSAYGRMMSNAERRFGVAGPTGGGSSRSSSGGGSSSRSSSSGGLQSKTERDSVAGPKRG